MIETEAHALSASLGDQDALAALYDRFSTPLLRYLTMRAQSNVTIAEDIAQTTWLRVAQSIPRYRSRGGGFEAWLFTIARRSLAEHYRGLSRRPEQLDGEMLAHDAPDPDADPATALSRKFEAHRVVAEVRGLNAAQRRCVTLRFFVGLSLEETATVMGKNTNTIKQLQYRALKLLAKRLSDAEIPGCVRVEPDTQGPAADDMPVLKFQTERTR